MFKELEYSKLKNFCNPDELGFKSIKEIESFSNIIGQNVASEALDFGLKIKAKGYNIFVSGVPGTGKTTFAKKYAKEIAESEPTPDDLCYVYNFENPKSPKLLRFPAGLGKKFKDDFDEVINVLSVEIPKAFISDNFESEKDKIFKTYQDKRDDIIKEMTEEAKKHEFGVKMTNSGMYFLPIIDGQTISEDDFDGLTDEQKDEISEKSELVQEKASEIMRVIKDYEKDTKKEIDDIEYNTGLLIVGRFFSSLQEQYTFNDEVIKYLKDVKEDIIENVDCFVEEESDEDEAMQLMAPWIGKKNSEDVLSKYKVNLIVDNSETVGAPVVENYNPTYTNLIGDIEYDNEYGNFTTDYMKIKPGILHEANGGYLILSVVDLLSNMYSWEALKRVIKTGEIVIEPLKEYQLGGISVSTIKPEKVKVDVKIILIGTSYYYDLLSENDDEFLKLFKICSMFDYEMDKNAENQFAVCQFIKNFTDRKDVLDFDASAVSKIIEYSSRISERQDKFTTKFSQLNEILEEANVWAKLDNSDIVIKKYVTKAIDKKLERMRLYENKLNDMILENEIMIDTEGKKIGQINGLAVMDVGGYTFGKPTRITATVYMGKAGIVNIEKEAEMSGCIHDKGVQVIIGFLGENFAQDFPLSLSCRICFEQNYNGIDGDSASSTELYCILSSLSGLPINQEISVTGSVNQKGEIQPIGGVTYKIEGFFDICAKRGLTGNQGVIIPVQNIKDIVLKDEVIEAVKAKKFHIYPISSIDEGIEILTGVKAGKKGARGKYPQNSIYGKVYKRLKKYYEKSIEEE